MENEIPGRSEIEADIQKSIDDMLREDYRPSPEGKYVELEQTKVPPLSSVDPEPTSKKPLRNIPALLKTVAISVGVVALFVLTAIFFSKAASSSIPPQGQMASEAANLHDVAFRASNVERKGGRISVDLAVENNSERNLFLTVRGIVLRDKDGEEYSSNLSMGTIPSDFFGDKILSGESQTATIVFDGVPETVPLTLVVQNVSDTHHYVWDYMVTLP